METRAKSAKGAKKSISLGVDSNISKRLTSKQLVLFKNLNSSASSPSKMNLQQNEREVQDSNFGNSPKNVEKDNINLNDEDFQEQFPLLEIAYTGEKSSPKIGIDIPLQTAQNENADSISASSKHIEQNLPSSWANTVKKPDSNIMSLKYIPSNGVSSAPYKMPAEIDQLGDYVWENSIVGYFLDNKLPFSVINDLAKKIWGKHGLEDTISCGNGFFLFKFNTSIGRDNVLELDPWNFYNRPIFIKKWSRDLNFNKEEFKTIPIWVKFLNIPLRYWTGLRLSHIASLIGVPICADDLTTKRKRLTFARILVEMSIESEFPRELKVESEDGQVFDIKVEYNWLPKACERCKIFGHSVDHCPKVTETKWVPKKVLVEENNRDQVTDTSKEANTSENTWTTVQKKIISPPKAKETITVSDRPNNVSIVA